MLFNSYEFIFLFLPVTIGIFMFMRRLSIDAALGWLIVASLVFYAWWRPVNLFIIVPSLLVNFFIARYLLHLAGDARNASRSRWVLGLGVFLNLCVLGFFKYITFLQIVSNDLFGTDFVLLYVVLPLGISFITFQKIAFLVDVQGGRVDRFKFREFCLFILFFPQLIAGPIVHFREMLPQFRSLKQKVDRDAVAAGLSLFVFGLFKKVVLADSIALHVSPIYSQAAAGEPISLILAWIAALGFTLQIYFDFSAYSDMAAGIARIVGVRLPLNFDSPLKATSIIDFWARWHITLTRFLTAYLYNPIALSVTRRRIAKRRSMLGGKRLSLGAFVSILALPTLFTMFVSGVWHGAGYMFVLWGVLHGVYLVINHLWRFLVSRHQPDNSIYHRLMQPTGFAMTFLSVVAGMVIFRSADFAQASAILAGMIGQSGIVLPASIFAGTGLESLWPGVISVGEVSAQAIAWIAGGLAIALLMPNALQWLERQQPVLDYKKGLGHRLIRPLAWQASVPWLVIIVTLGCISVWNIGGKSEFLYWQF